MPDKIGGESFRQKSHLMQDPQTAQSQRGEIRLKEMVEIVEEAGRARSRKVF